jgi:hypothetical protein
MSEPRVTIRFDRNGRTYRPGERLSGAYRLESIPRDEVKTVEVSVLWHTDGKGDEDLAVHDFWRRSVEDDAGGPIQIAGRFETVLPNSPMSYEGAILKIRWCVRVRVFLTRDREVVGETRFRLGEVAAAAKARTT